MGCKNILEIFGHNVQKYRRAKQLSQEKLAEFACVHRTYIGMIERAEKNITLRNMGSGTTAVVAKKLGRNYVGYETEQDFINIAEKRLNYVEQKLF